MSKKGSYGMSIQGMQDTGVHYMGVNLKHELTPEQAKVVADRTKEEIESYAMVIPPQGDIKPTDNKVLVPVTNRVIVLPYDKNPYRTPVHQSKSGLIIGDFGTAAYVKSQDTGEKEELKRGIWCCKVIAVGNECKNVVVGEDVYINFTMAAPVPFGNEGYYTISENNIICSVREAE